MAKKREVDEKTKELKTHLQSGKVVIGADRVLKMLKQKKLVKVYLASNCPDQLKEDLQYYAQLAKVPCLNLDYNNEELGVFCKKNYFVATLGVMGE
jgi:large subunit ribosomal protein L30e